MAARRIDGNAVLDLASELIARPSVTPRDAGCQELIAARLAAAGGRIRRWGFGAVDNLLVTFGEESGARRRHLMFLGHTDVVPAGDEQAWRSPPFSPEVRDGVLYGRGAADMKGAVAAMVVALECWAAARPAGGKVSLLLTSDEEGEARDGIRRVAPLLAAEGLVPDYCLVGEPSCTARLGDTVRRGRRGSMYFTGEWHGAAGHSAYQDPAANPAHRAVRALAALTAVDFADGGADFPGTTLNLTRLESVGGAGNVTPARSLAEGNLRHPPSSPARVLQQRLSAAMQAAGAAPDRLEWDVRAEPYYTAAGQLLAVLDRAIAAQLGSAAHLDTGGGTSDGRFLAALGAEVAEFGLVNRTIHRVDESTPVADLERLAEIYLALIDPLLTQ